MECDFEFEIRSRVCVCAGYLANLLKSKVFVAILFTGKLNATILQLFMANECKTNQKYCQGSTF